MSETGSIVRSVLPLTGFFGQTECQIECVVAALLPKIPWCGPGAGLVRAWCALACEGVVRQTHYPRQPADVEASKVGILPRKKI